MERVRELLQDPAAEIGISALTLCTTEHANSLQELRNGLSDRGRSVLPFPSMQYMVTGADGKEYGPTDIATLQAWAAENRLAPHTQLRDFSTGQMLAASAVPGLFPQPMNVPPVTSAYPRAGANIGIGWALRLSTGH